MYDFLSPYLFYWKGMKGVMNSKLDNMTYGMSSNLNLTFFVPKFIIIIF